MTKINIIIAKRGRDDYLKLVLHNLNQSDNIRNYDVAFYVGEDMKDNIDKVDYSIYKNIKVNHLYIPNLPQAGKLFCRGHIMDMLLREMRQDYDFFCILDTDLVYQPNFLDDMVNTINRSTNDVCVLANGSYMEQNADIDKIFKHNYSYQQIMEKYKHTPHTGSSQISFSKKYHGKIKQALNIESIYDTGSLGYYFIGWGREDTLVRKIILRSGAELIALKNSWVHVWHPPQEMKQESMSYNADILSLLEDEVKDRMQQNGLVLSPMRKLANSINIFNGGI